MTFYITPLPNTFGKLWPGKRDSPLNASLLSSLVPPMFQKTPTSDPFFPSYHHHPPSGAGALPSFQAIDDTPLVSPSPLFPPG